MHPNWNIIYPSFTLFPNVILILMVVNMVISACYEFCIPQWQQLIIGFVNFLHAYICYPVFNLHIRDKIPFNFQD